MQHINESNFEEFISANVPVFVEFSAAWCGPCKALEPILAEVENDYKKELIFGKIDVDESPILAQKFNVHGIPAIIIFSNGVPVGLNLGFMDKNRLVDFIEDSLANKI